MHTRSSSAPRGQSRSRSPRGDRRPSSGGRQNPYLSEGPSARNSRGGGRPSYQQFRSRVESRRPMRRKRSMGISIEDFVAQAKVPVTHKVIPTLHQSFTEFELDERVLASLAKRGYTSPTPIQDHTITHALAGKDVIGLAATGTGKTAAFLLPIIHKLLSDPKSNAIILAPTRELALQIVDELKQLTLGTNLRHATCVGGMPIYHQIRDLNRKPAFIVGTPGRVQDLIDKGRIPLQHFNTVVLDEADHMIDVGFYDAITNILSGLPSDRQTLFFSATMPPKIKQLTSRFLKDPITVELSVGKATHHIDQQLLPVPDYARIDTLHGILTTPEASKVIIFSETKRSVEDLTTELLALGHRAVSLHGDKDQRERRRALDDFTREFANILIATDVAARGLDIKNVSHVINYTVPQTFDDYVHRIGRTGRAGSKGVAITFV